MKKILTLAIFIVFISYSNAQTVSSAASAANSSVISHGSELVIKGGMGKVKGGLYGPLFFNILTGPGVNTTGSISSPTLKWGLNAGLDFNYYFSRGWGVSGTFDWFSNAYKLNEASNPPFDPGKMVLTSQKNQDNKFIGAGPIKNFGISNKLRASLALYAGVLAHTKKSYLSQYKTTPFLGSGVGGLTPMLTFTSNKANWYFAAKGSARVIYDVNSKLGISLGVEYIKPSYSKDVSKNNGFHSSSAGMLVNFPTPGVVFATTNSFDSAYSKGVASSIKQRVETNQSLSLLAVNLGVHIKLNGKKIPRKPRTPKVKECCTTCPEYFLAVTARDKYTKEVLPNTDVAIKNEKGEIIKTAKTNAFGVAIFEKIIKQNYKVEGLLNNVALENSQVNENELICDVTVQKEILYADRNFIIKGKAVVCNTTTPISGINVSLENKDMAFKKSTMTDADGNFLLQLPETGIYDLYGRKESYFSQIEKVSSSDYNRDKTLFVKLEMCAEKADCGKAINLQNILFDLDKYVIKEAAKKELNRLVRFMQDNPSVKVELSSHTDCRNTDAYNQTLSQNRANASVDYVVSQGIARDRLIGVGYGEKKLLNRCSDGVNCSEAEHSINRRTEMKVICPNGN